MAKFNVRIGWTEIDGRRWTAIYTRNRPSMKKVTDVAFSDFKYALRDSDLHNNNVSVEVSTKLAGYPSGFDLDNCHITGSGGHLKGRIHALCEDGSTRLYMMEAGIIGVSDWMWYDDHAASTYIVEGL